MGRNLVLKHPQLELIARQSMELCPEEMEPYICAFQTKDTVRKSGIMLQGVSSSQDFCMPVMDGLEATRLIPSFQETGSWDAAVQAGVEPSVLSSNSSCDASQEKVHIPEDKPYIFLRGNGRGRTAIVWSESSSHNNASTTFIVEAPHFIAFGISFKSLCGPPGLQCFNVLKIMSPDFHFLDDYFTYVIDKFVQPTPLERSRMGNEEQKQISRLTNVSLIGS
ncbi:hypothetical protein ACFE04_020550 [Oxalis oulophora]